MYVRNEYLLYVNTLIQLGFRNIVHRVKKNKTCGDIHL